MLEQYTQSMIEEAIDELLISLKNSGVLLPFSWSFTSSKDAELIQEKGFLLIKWRERRDGDRLKATFSYNEDESSPLISLVFDRDNNLQELEIWRGDGGALMRIPRAEELTVPIELQGKR